jgi:hypothetical protein
MVHDDDPRVQRTEGQKVVGLTTPGDSVVVVCTAEEHVMAVAELLTAETGAVAVVAGEGAPTVTLSGATATRSVFSFISY